MKKGERTMKSNFNKLLIALMCLMIPSFAASEEKMVTGAAGIVQSSEFYWVTFSGDCSCDSVFVMQIDANGNIIKAPKEVLNVETYGAGASALVKLGGSKLVLLHWNGFSYMTRAIINKSTLNASAVKNTNLYSIENEFLHVTQKKSGNFLIAEDYADGSLSAVKISKKGLPKSGSTDISPAAPLNSDEASIASDGLFVVTNRFSNTGGKEKLYVQPLDDTGAPVGNPKLIAKFKDVESVDVTNPLPDGNRFVVYTVDAGTTPDDRIYLQTINETGKKVGGKKLINTPPDRSEDSQTVAIDPLGRFVLFTMGGDDYGCAGSDILVYQALASDGSANGSVKVLGSCELVTDDIMNLDIVIE
jgi:hypothetical protein